MTLLFANRRLKIAYWDQDTKFANAAKLNLERRLGRLADVEITEVGSILDLTGYDLVLIAAHSVPATVFSDWLRGLIKRMSAPQHIWTPAMIIAPIQQGQLMDAIVELSSNNWYFDVVDPEQLDSLPIRVANLVRIHDHLKELMRYQSELSELDRRVQSLEGRIK